MFSFPLGVSRRDGDKKLPMGRREGEGKGLVPTMGEQREGEKGMTGKRSRMPGCSVATEVEHTELVVSTGSEEQLCLTGCETLA